MKEDSKYYTPSIEEFHIGFEYEYFLHAGGTHDWSMQEGTENKWHKQTWSVTFEQRTLPDHINKGDIRVKHLDRDDVEDLGYEYHSSEGPIDRFKIKSAALGDYYLVTGYRGVSIECVNPETDKLILRRVWSIKVKNKSELKRLMDRIDVVGFEDSGIEY